MCVLNVGSIGKGIIFIHSTVAQERKEKKTQNGRMFLKKSIFLCCACSSGVKTSLNLIAMLVCVYGNKRIEQNNNNNNFNI